MDRTIEGAESVMILQRIVSDRRKAVAALKQSQPLDLSPDLVRQRAGKACRDLKQAVTTGGRIGHYCGSEAGFTIQRDDPPGL